MATTYKSVYKRFNGTDWDTHYFKTSADIIVETTTYKVLTATERTAISNYLTTFNAANKLLKLDGSGLVPEALIPGGLGYLPLTGGTMTGGINMGSNSITVNTIAGSASTAMNITAGTNMYLNSGPTNGSIFLVPTGTGITNVGGKRIGNLAAPTSGTDAATKTYVDNLITAGLNVASAPVKAATITNITLSGEQTIDDLPLSTGDRVLVWNQSSTGDNGIYTVAVGAWTKITADSIQGTLVFVEYGTLHNDWLFVNQNGTTWVEFSKPDTIVAGNGLTRIGNTISIPNVSVTNAMLAGSITLAKLADFASADTDAWGSIAAATTSNAMSVKLQDIFSAIKNLRGTTNYNTNNTQTISGAYTLVSTKIQSYVAADGTESSISNPTTGDLFFGTLA